MQDNVWKYGIGSGMLRLVAAWVLVFFATCAYSASKTVLVLGDSLSAEYGISRGAGWVSLLEQRIRSDRIGASIVNASISGETTSGGKTRLPALLSQHRPTVVVIELGANDGLRGLPLQAAESNLRTMIRESQKAKARVLLVGMQIPPNYGREYAQRFAGLYERLAKETGATLAPFLLDGVASKLELFQADRIHPRAEAQPIILDNIWPHLKPLLAR